MLTPSAISTILLVTMAIVLVDQTSAFACRGWHSIMPAGPAWTLPSEGVVVVAAPGSRHVVTPPKPCWRLAAASDDDRESIEEPDEEDPGSQLKGKHRRFLRSLAGRKKADKSLHTIQQSAAQPSERFMTDLQDALRSHELVNIRALFAVNKKETKAVAASIAASLAAELVQVLGKTFLLYRPGVPPRIDLSQADAVKAQVVEGDKE